MTKEELYAEFCIEYPMVQGYRETTYESWLEKQVIDSRTEVVNKNDLLQRVIKCPFCSSKDIAKGDKGWGEYYCNQCSQYF